jgi:hypothetical protein
VRQHEAVLPRERNGLLAAAKRRVLTVRLRSEQRNDKPGSGVASERIGLVVSARSALAE